MSGEESGSEVDEMEAYAVGALAGETVKEHIIDLDMLEKMRDEIVSLQSTEKDAEFKDFLRLRTVSSPEREKKQKRKFPKVLRGNDRGRDEKYDGLFSMESNRVNGAKPTCTVTNFP